VTQISNNYSMDYAEHLRVSYHWRNLYATRQIAGRLPDRPRPRVGAALTRSLNWNPADGKISRRPRNCDLSDRCRPGSSFGASRRGNGAGARFECFEIVEV
jgi:hypothetical protein